jgi:hypothetical protein
MDSCFVASTAVSPAALGNCFVASTAALGNCFVASTVTEHN